MVFLFSYDVPIVEVMLILSLLTLIAVVLLFISLHRSKQANKKLDELLIEEKEFKKELDLTKQEEDQQLALIRTIAKELHTLDAITKEEHEGMAAVQRLARRASSKYKSKSIPAELRDVLAQLAKHVAELDHVSSREDKQLENIKRIASTLRR